MGSPHMRVKGDEMPSFSQKKIDLEATILKTGQFKISFNKLNWDLSSVINIIFLSINKTPKNI